MLELPLYSELLSIDVPLQNLFLDPNNPRFAEFEPIPVLDNDIEAAQNRVQYLLTQHYQIDKLRMNIEVNGYLPIDRVVVRQFADDEYVVLEGNRRIAAAKSLTMMAADGAAVGDEVLSSLKVIPCLQYTGTDDNAAWVFQGVRHISGVYDWTAFNKAKLLVDQMEENGLNLTAVGKRFGLTPHGAGQWVRGYSAFKQAREKSDYTNEVLEESYPYFQELFSLSSIAVREWMEWDENKRQFNNELHFNEFVSWLYPRKKNEDDPGRDDKGDWEARRLQRRDDIRALAYLIKFAPEEFHNFRLGSDLEASYSMAQTRKYEENSRKNRNPAEQAFDAIETCVKALEDIPLKVVRDDVTRGRLYAALDDLQNAINTLRA